MRIFARGAALAALIGLTACGRDSGAANDAAGNPAKAPEAAPGNAAPADRQAPPPVSNGAAPPAAAPLPNAETRTLLIGRWAEGGDCAAAVEIRADGTFTSPQAGEGRWELSAMDYLDLVGSRATIEVAVQEIDRAAMVTINPQGRIGRWTRC